MSLRDIEASLPPGFRFHPSDEELVFHYLSRKVANEEVLKGSLVEVDLHACEPWQLPEVAKLNSNEWYFFSFRDRKYATGFRTNRATTSGYWKATGKDRMVHDPRKRAIVGMRKTLVFYLNRAPNGIKTGWIMHEFRLENPHVPPKEDWVLCRVFNKSRGETSNNLNPNFMFENSTALATSSLSDHTMIPNFDHSQKVNSSELNNSNFLQLSQEVNNTSMISEINSNGEDEFGFLFGMSFEESSLGDHVHPNLGEMRFEDDGSLIFL